MSNEPDVFNKNQRHKFDERLLERCYTMRHSIRTNDRKNKYIKLKSNTQRIKKKVPYWNIWRAVFAGWLIRYPGKIFNIIRFPLFGLIGAIVVILCNI